MKKFEPNVRRTTTHPNNPIDIQIRSCDGFHPTSLFPYDHRPAYKPSSIRQLAETRISYTSLVQFVQLYESTHLHGWGVLSLGLVPYTGLVFRFDIFSPIVCRLLLPRLSESGEFSFLHASFIVIRDVPYVRTQP